MRAITVRDLKDLSWQRFEDLVAALIFREHPTAEKLANPDGGADVLLEREGEGTKAWQAKHHPGDIHWKNCVESLDKMIENYSPTEVIFAFPRNLSGPLKESFKLHLKDRYPDVDISYISGSKLIDMLRDCSDDFKSEFFGPDPRNQAAEIGRYLAAGGLTIARQPQTDSIAQRFLIADEAGRRDRYFRTEVALRTGEAPATSWSEPPTLLLSHSESDRELRIAAWAENGAKGTILDLAFAEGKEGLRARWEIAMELARRGEATLPKGATARLNRFPEAVRAITGESVEALADVTLRPEVSSPVNLTATREGERLERTMRVVPLPPLQVPTAGVETFNFGCLDGELALLIDVFVNKAEDKVSVRTHLSLAIPDPEIPEGVVDALRLLVAIDEGSGSWEAPSLLPVGPVSLERSGDEEILRHNRTALAFFESLRTIERSLQVDRFRLEKGIKASGEDIDAAQVAAKTLETGEAPYQLETLEVDLPAAEVEALRLSGDTSLVGRLPIEIEVLGRHLRLGVGEAEVPRPDEISVDEGSSPSRRNLSVRWSDKPRVTFNLIDDAAERVREFGIWTVERVPRLPQ